MNGPKAPQPLIADRRLYLAADSQTLLENDDARAAFLLVASGCTIDASEVERLGLSLDGERVVQLGAAQVAALDGGADDVTGAESASAGDGANGQGGADDATQDAAAGPGDEEKKEREPATTKERKTPVETKGVKP